MRLLKRAMKRGWRHWAVVALVLAVSVPLTPTIGRLTGLNVARQQLFQMLGTLSGRPLVPRIVRFVMVQDDDYATELQSRVPIVRGYVAKIIDALVEADADVIAIDFDLRIRHPASRAALPSDDKLYDGEVRTLVEAIVRAARRGKIVLPKRITPSGGWYALGEDNYQRFGICTRLRRDGTWESPGPPDMKLEPRVQANINCGYIQLTTEAQQIPPWLDLGEKGRIDSFGLGVVRAWAPELAENVRDYPLYGTFLPSTLLEDRLLETGKPRIGDIVVSSRQLLARDPDAMRIVHHRPVIVGARWHNPQRPNEYIDMHDTPVGPENGSLMHASYVEAILDGRLYDVLPDWVLFVLEIVFSLGAAVMLAAYAKTWAKALVFAAFAIGLVILQWLMLNGVGAAFDAVLPLLALFLHSWFERPVDRAFGAAIDLWHRIAGKAS